MPAAFIVYRKSLSRFSIFIGLFILNSPDTLKPNGCAIIQLFFARKASCGISPLQGGLSHKSISRCVVPGGGGGFASFPLDPHLH